MLAICLRDLANLSFVQARPAFLKRRKALSPIMARTGFNAVVVIEILQMDGCGLTKGHLRRDLAIAVADALTMFFEKFRELGLRHAKM